MHTTPVGLRSRFAEATWRRRLFPLCRPQPGYDGRFFRNCVTAGLFFLFLPFFKKIKIGKILELEREVEKAKEELREFKAEVRNSVSVLSTNVNSISGMTNRIDFYNNVPSVPQMEQEARILDQRAPATVNSAQEVQRVFLQQDDDIVISLFKTRVEIERLLRKIVGISTNLPPGKDIRMAGLPQLFEMFLAQSPEYKYLQTSLRYVNQVCEVLALGAKIIATLDDFLGEPPHTSHPA